MKMLKLKSEHKKKKNENKFCKEKSYGYEIHNFEINNNQKYTQRDQLY